jgi:hypothetical protein
MIGMESAAVEQKKCGRNGCERPPSKNHKWCRQCRNVYQGEYRSLQIKNAYNDGARAMRERIAAAFFSQPGGIFGGSEIAKYVSRLEIPSPKVEPEIEETE